jgi:hypothetical protein
VVISFLASLLGLGGFSDKIKQIVKAVQAPINKAIDWLLKTVVKPVVKLAMRAVAWVGGKINKAKQWGKKKWDAAKAKAKAKWKSAKDKFQKKFGKKDDRTPQQKQADLNSGLADAGVVLQDPKATEVQIRKQLVGIKSKYRMQGLNLVVDSKGPGKETVHVKGSINPTGQTGQSTIALATADHLINKKVLIKDARKQLVVGVVERIEGPARIVFVRLSMGKLKGTALGIPEPAFLNDYEGRKQRVQPYEGGVHESKYAVVEGDGFALHPDYRGQSQWRPRFYGGFSAAVNQWLEQMLSSPFAGNPTLGICHPEDVAKEWSARRYWYQGKYYLNSGTTNVASIDHSSQPVVDHWNTAGHDTDQSARKTWYNQMGDFTIIPKSINSSLGASLKMRAKWKLGIKFRGPDEQ